MHAYEPEETALDTIPPAEEVRDQLARLDRRRRLLRALLRLALQREKVRREEKPQCREPSR